LIYLLRHGDAEAGNGDDAARRLTAKGERQSELAGRALAALGVEVDACLTSPKVRAADTARLACQALGVEPEVVEALSGEDFDPAELAAGRGTVVLVGHEPSFTNAIAAATAGRVKLKKGGIAALDGRELQALWRPAELALLASPASS
jgi:phosphohistidine phosphatase